MRKHIPVFALSILLAVCLMPISVFGTSKAELSGHKNIPSNVPKVTEQDLELNMELAEELPAKLDPRTDDWFTRNKIDMRDQGNTNLCWAFAATNAAQISYSVETYDQENPKLVPELSPAHLGYFFYNRENDPLGNTGEDENGLVYTDNWIDEGGINRYTFQHMATWSGAGAESDTPFDIAVAKGSVDKSFAYKNALTLQNSEFYESLPAASGVDTIKAMIDRYGAVVAAIYSNEEDFFNKVPGCNDEAFYNPNLNKADHEVTIIGWDDDFPKENFTGTSTPKNNGAWLILNSWVVEEGDSGYLWASYECAEIMNQGILGMDMQEADPSVSLYQYDGTAIDEYKVLKANDIAANIYTAPKDHQIRLKEIGFTTWTPGASDYTLKIYAGLTDKDKPTSGVLQIKQQLNTDSPGYKTFRLVNPIVIDAGETFAVDVTCENVNAFGKECDYIYYDSEIHKDVVVAKAGINSGQSFYYDQNTKNWYDIAKVKSPFCFRIKAVAEDAVCIHQYAEESRVDAQKGVSGYAIEKCKNCAHRVKTVLPALKPVPDNTKITKLVKAKKAMTVKWRKSTEKIAGQNIDGYQIRYSLKKTMKSSKKVMVRDYRVTSKKIKKLKAKKKYYVQIRTFKKTDGKTYYSGWSAAKAVKTR